MIVGDKGQKEAYYSLCSCNGDCIFCDVPWCKYRLDEELKNIFSLYSPDTVPGGHTEEQETQSGHIHMVYSQTERIHTGTVGRRHTSAQSRRADTGTVPCRDHKCDSVNPLDHSYMADTPETKHMRFQNSAVVKIQLVVFWVTTP